LKWTVLAIPKLSAETKLKFEELPLKPSILKAIADRGFENPTDIQAESIPRLATEEIDFVGQAQTGTGKTAAFVLPLLNKIDVMSDSIQAVVLTPTRELANQICEEVKKFSTYEDIRTLSVYGGTPIHDQIRGLKRNRPHFIVGTPGRVLDLIRRGILKLSNTKYAILDEADEMLDMGFIDDVKTILSEFSEQRKTWMFSATMPRQIMGLIQNYLNEPFVVSIKKKTLSNENIEQKYYIVKRHFQTEALCRILESLDDTYGIVFCRTRVDAKNVSDDLNFRGFTSDALHGDMSQAQRDITMKRFKQKKVKILVCTDVAARGIDVDSLTHVFNYGWPQDMESYVHRIGRTGRAGAKGVAISIIEKNEVYRVRHIENMTKARMEKSSLPTGQDLKQVMVAKELKKFEALIEANAEAGSMDESFGAFQEGLASLEKDELVKVMFSYMFKDSLERYNKKLQLEAEQNDRRELNRNAGPRVASNGNVRFFLNMGKEHGLTLDTLLQAVSNGVRVDRNQIRNVDMKETFSFLEVPAKFKDDVLNLGGVSINNRNLRFEVTKSSKRFGGGNGGGDRRRGSFRSRDNGGFRGQSGSRDGGFRGQTGSRDGGSRDGVSRDGGSRAGSFRDSRKRQ